MKRTNDGVNLRTVYELFAKFKAEMYNRANTDEEQVRDVQGTVAQQGDSIGDIESATIELAEMAAENEISISDLADAVIELAELIVGEE